MLKTWLTREGEGWNERLRRINDLYELIQNDNADPLLLDLMNTVKSILNNLDHNHPQRYENLAKLLKQYNTGVSSR